MSCVREWRNFSCLFAPHPLPPPPPPPPCQVDTAGSPADSARRESVADRLMTGLRQCAHSPIPGRRLAPLQCNKIKRERRRSHTTAPMHARRVSVRKHSASAATLLILSSIPDAFFFFLKSNLTFNSGPWLATFAPSVDLGYGGRNTHAYSAASQTLWSGGWRNSSVGLLSLPLSSSLPLSGSPLKYYRQPIGPRRPLCAARGGGAK